MNDNTVRRIYTKRAPRDINIYAMNDTNTTQKLSKKEKEKLYYLRNKERIAERNKINRERDREKYRQNSAYYKSIAKEHYNRKKEFYSKKSKERNSKRNSYYKIKRDSEPGYKAGCYIRSRIYLALRRDSIRKNIETEKLLGCTIAEARAYIELQFKQGMSWDNYSHGTWHIDHIRPVNTFDLTDIEQQKQCFHYTNLRPLWAKENLSRPKDGRDIGS